MEYLKTPNLLDYIQFTNLIIDHCISYDIFVINDDDDCNDSFWKRRTFPVFGVGRLLLFTFFFQPLLSFFLFPPFGVDWEVDVRTSSGLHPFLPFENEIQIIKNFSNDHKGLSLVLSIILNERSFDLLIEVSSLFYRVLMEGIQYEQVYIPCFRLYESSYPTLLPLLLLYVRDGI